MSRQPIRARVALERYCQRPFPRPDYEGGPLNGMLIGLCVMVVVGLGGLLIWGGR